MRLPAPPPGPTTAWDRVGVTLLALCGALGGLLEVLLVPLYAGKIIMPLSVALALLGNVALPMLSRSLIGTTFAALAPFAAWLVVVLAFGAIGRPEGDVILPAAPRAVEIVTYAVLLGGTLAGTVTVVLLAPPPAAGRRPTRRPR